MVEGVGVHESSLHRGGGGQLIEDEGGWRDGRRVREGVVGVRTQRIGPPRSSTLPP